MTKTKRTLMIVMTYISIVGLITFSLFILEEAIQTVMFGTWAAQDAKRWDTVKQGADLMEKFTNIGRVITWCAVIQPLAFISYRAYFESSDYYIDALRSKAMANAPDLFIDEKVTMRFKPLEARKNENGFWIGKSGRMQVQYETKPLMTVHSVTGILTRIDSKYLLITVENE